ncbi:Crp/Fnr family transcriptional regulator [Aliifodinibius sp. S!AR15-10]|uniref:Crp/Fnr family transcriptional regulator n=1 Tax=Aliifodinibius sp. S!AR15-10 TaxID=2950437 RepID=UPI0028658127|nr:Crp/Fnr family transcriptional regulator [Aliifodinibius sp. S!AR15-10]MDR8389721.1 Crp/Fnr family transcriptional regulator [Aliifodinibius sp. S!AR15-10]
MEISSVKTLNKGELFIREGEVPREFGFVSIGLFRYYYVDEKGNHFTKGFFPENSVLSSYTAMAQKESSPISVEALEDSEIVVVDYQKWKELQSQHRCWDKFLIILLEKGYATKVRRERELLLFDAETQYRLFRERYPNLEDRIPQHLISSFLGITPVALSRIRKKMGLINTG